MPPLKLFLKNSVIFLTRAKCAGLETIVKRENKFSEVQQRPSNGGHETASLEKVDSLGKTKQDRPKISLCARSSFLLLFSIWDSFCCPVTFFDGQVYGHSSGKCVTSLFS